MAPKRVTALVKECDQWYTLEMALYADSPVAMVDVGVDRGKAGTRRGSKDLLSELGTKGIPGMSAHRRTIMRIEGHIGQ